ncbi:MAG: PASTA domain-containing protein [Ignavibacteriae bacterium]|nr:PASTA domain-containing protein [Ignavibacteriota bacterium]MCB0723295.1 PASTA domain-containing protein [Ignavibacteriota bacterium]MCB9243141.1 PASTA domain-containing protein [Ignavibacteriales bacterium]
MPLYVKQSNTVEVPNVVGMNFRDAKTLIEEAGLEVKQGENRYDESKPIGMILDQNPPSGQMVKAGRRIYLYPCGGEQLIEVPKLTGRTLRDARFTLEQRGLEIGDVVRKFSNEYQDEVIISQIIQPGSKVKRNSKIAMIVSNGPEIGSLRVPDLIGKTLDEARKLIIDSKLKVGKITYQASSDVTPGKVLDQYPKKDKSANETTVVDLFISKKRVVELDEEIPEIDVEDGNTDQENIKPTPQNPGNDNDQQQDQNDTKEKKDTKKDTKKDSKKDKKKVVPKPIEGNNDTKNGN